jgi:hypothetical protein
MNTVIHTYASILQISTSLFLFNKKSIFNESYSPINSILMLGLRKLKIILSIFLISNFLNAQDTGFFKYYPEFEDVQGLNLFNFRSGYLAFCESVARRNSYVFVEISKDGEAKLLFENKIGSDSILNVTFSNSCIQIDTNKFIVASTRSKFEADHLGDLVVELLIISDTIERKKLVSIQDPTFNYCSSLKFKDGLLYLLGGRVYNRLVGNSIFRDSSKAIFYKIDLLQGILSQTFIPDSNRYNTPNSLILNDDQILISQSGGNDFFPSEYKLKAYDLGFGLNWQHRIPISSFAESPPFLELISDSTIVFAGSSIFENASLINRGDIRVEFLNLEGNSINQIWVKRSLTQYMLTSMVKSGDGQLLACGWDVNSVSNLGGNGTPRLTKINSNGEIVWDRLYWDRGDEFTESLLQNILVDPENNLLGIGTYYDFSNQSGASPARLLILKVDSMGCLNKNCDDLIYTSTKGVQSSGKEEIEINVYPNPTNNEIFIESELNIAALELFDNYGKIQFSDFNLGTTKNAEIDVSNLKDGIYFLRLLLENNVVVMKKVIVKS